MAYVEYERDGEVALITLNRPERLNAFGSGISAGIKECFARFMEDDGALAAVFSGRGRAFCAGVDVKEVAERGSMFVEDPFTHLYPFGSQELIKPVVAAIHGYCLGAGFNLLTMNTDIPVAADTAIFGLPELERGIYTLTTPFYHQLPRNIIMELSLLGENITAQRAYELGAINRVVPEEKLMATAMEVARKLASVSPVALRLTKQGILKATQVPEAAWHQEVHLFSRSTSSADMAEGMKAWAQKRDPRWKGK
jgi:enoyl-CoA hydratase/carnithine racemase